MGFFDTDEKNAPGKPPLAKAVAVTYARGEEPAPRITASGRGAVAEQIVAIALASGVKVREDADLAELLSALEAGAFIPLEAFAAVAEILSYVYKANASHAQRNTGQDPST